MTVFTDVASNSHFLVTVAFYSPIQHGHSIIKNWIDVHAIRREFIFVYLCESSISIIFHENKYQLKTFAAAFCPRIPFINI